MSTTKANFRRLHGHAAFFAGALSPRAPVATCRGIANSGLLYGMTLAERDSGCGTVRGIELQTFLFL